MLTGGPRIYSQVWEASLSLLVYTLAHREIRAALSSSKSTIKNQFGIGADFT